jgi:8-oxo-dGTP diphosphatase
MEETKKVVRAGVGVLLVREESGVRKVLLGHRHEDPEKASSALNGAGTWTCPGGKMDFGDGFEEGAARELLEETGIVVEPSDFSFASLSNERVPTAQFVTTCWLATKFTGEPRVMEPDEITEWAWFDINNLPEPMYLPSLHAIENYRSGKVYLRR